MGATNDCGIDQDDHSIEVWFFFDFDLDCDVDIVDIMKGSLTLELRSG